MVQKVYGGEKPVPIWLEDNEESNNASVKRILFSLVVRIKVIEMDCSFSGSRHETSPGTYQTTPWFFFVFFLFIQMAENPANRDDAHELRGTLGNRFGGVSDFESRSKYIGRLGAAARDGENLCENSSRRELIAGPVN